MSANKKTIFKQIIDGEIPAKIVYEDEHSLVFRDIAPQAPMHLLVIPKKEIQNLDEATVDDEKLLGHLMLTIQKVTREAGVNSGYRIISNCGESAGQTVHHLHFHILAGREMEWPPV